MTYIEIKFKISYKRNPLILPITRNRLFFLQKKKKKKIGVTSPHKRPAGLAT